MKYIICISLILLAGCAGFMPHPTTQTLQSTDYGKYPDSYEQIIKDFFGGFLLDPYSAHYNFKSTPSRAYECESFAGDVRFGYLVKVGVNAKNRMGGYTGEISYNCLLRNDKVLRYCEEYGTPWTKFQPVDVDTDTAKVGDK